MFMFQVYDIPPGQMYSGQHGAARNQGVYDVPPSQMDARTQGVYDIPPSSQGVRKLHKGHSSQSCKENEEPEVFIDTVPSSSINCL